MHGIHRLIPWAAAFFLLVTAATACSGNYGHLRRDGEARKIFEGYQVLPDHRYFYSGSSSTPTAILGIHKDFTLQTKLWTSVDLTPEQLKSWMNNISPTLGRSLNNYGSVIVDPAGKTVGIWYSKYSRTTIEFKENNIIIVYAPKPDSDLQFRKFSDR
jgi:hypothetical protein